MSIDNISEQRIRIRKEEIGSLNRQYSDLNLKFRIHPSFGDIVPLKEVDAIKNSVRHILSTSKGERPFKPWLGCNLKRYLFEPADAITMTYMKNEIAYSLNEQEPRISVEDVVITDDPDGNAYYITVKITIKNIQRSVDVELFLERTR